VTEVQRLLAAINPIVITLANQVRWPFAARLPKALHRDAQRIGRELYG
jgi:hypothetical protein